MLKRWLYRLKLKIFYNDVDFRLDYIVDNIDKVTLTTLNTVVINKIYYSMGDSKCKDITEKILYIRRVVDEEIDKTLSYNYMLRNDSSEIYLLSLFTTGSYTSHDFRELLRKLLIEYSETKRIVSDSNRSDITIDHNCKIFESHIITMEDIVNKVFISISK